METKVTADSYFDNSVGVNCHDTVYDDDERYMRRCIQLALNGEGYTSPNPMVGAVVVCEGRIIGEGWHHRAGEPHAEVNAIAAVADKSLLHCSTIYVNLEPCAHEGRTPPCADLIIRMGIPRVVVGCRDTFGLVDGRGVQKLRDAGIAVRVGVLEQECRWLNRRFLTVHELHRPYIILKWAQTLDGFIGGLDGDRRFPIAISDRQCLREVHRQRAVEDAILIGRGTGQSDNPSLTVRFWQGRQPKRYVIDPNLKLPKELNIFKGENPATVFNSVVDSVNGGVCYRYVDFKKRDIINEMLKSIAADGCQSVIVEGGGYTLQSFIEAGRWDEIFLYQSDMLLGNGVAAPHLSFSYDSITSIGNCRLYHYTAPYNIFEKNGRYGKVQSK